MGRTALPLSPGVYACTVQSRTRPWPYSVVSSYWLGFSIPDLAERDTPSTSCLVLVYALEDGNADGD
jgi:hypothetical protein